jgi:uncharacterized protein (DUF736 family)
MAFQHNEGSGSLFRNDKKTSDKQPSHRGTANFEGQIIEIAAWVKEKKDGTKYFSLKLQRPYSEREADGEYNHSGRGNPNGNDNSAPDDDIPF